MNQKYKYSIIGAIAGGVGVWAFTMMSTTAWTRLGRHSRADLPTTTRPAQLIKEENFTLVTLSEAAEKKIGLATAEIRRHENPSLRLYGGEVMLQPGHGIVVTAPVTGYLAAPPDRPLEAGKAVAGGAAIFRITPLLTPEARANLSITLADADGQVNNAMSQKQLAQITLDRATRVLREGAGSQRSVDEAQGAFDLASKTLAAAEARQSLLRKVVGGSEQEGSVEIAVPSPISGIVRAVHGAPGQLIAAGAPLAEISDVGSVWIRASIPVEDIARLDVKKQAFVGGLSRMSGGAVSELQPVEAPPTANPLTSTIDAYYLLPGKSSDLVVGQRVTVSIPERVATRSMVVPWSAVVTDISGGTWVYEQREPQRYLRRRVAVRYSVNGDAVLADGPPEGSRIAIAGVQELFAVETGL